MIKQILTTIVCVACFAFLIFYNYSLEAQPFSRSTGQYEGTQVIRQAIESFNLVRTIDSKVRLKVYMFGNEYTGSGRYQEKRNRSISNDSYSPNLYLLVLRFQPTSLSGVHNSSTLKIVADGSYIWMVTNLEEQKKLERIDLGKIYDILQKEEKISSQSKDSSFTGRINSTDNNTPYRWNSRLNRVNLGNITSVGGLQGTLMQLEKFYDFETALVESEQLGRDLGNVGVWKVTAMLKKEKLEAMESLFTGRKHKVEQQTRHIPRMVCIYFGKSDFFPYRISYFNQWSEEEINQPIIDIDYPGAMINQNDIATTTFRFQQPDDDSVLLIDVTEKYLNNMEL